MTNVVGWRMVVAERRNVLPRKGSGNCPGGYVQGEMSGSCRDGGSWRGEDLLDGVDDRGTPSSTLAVIVITSLSPPIPSNSALTFHRPNQNTGMLYAVLFIGIITWRRAALGLYFFYLPDCLHDNGTGPDLSCSSFYF